MTIARLLSDHFARTGEKQAEFARRVGLTPQTVSQLARGDIKVPTADVRRKLARAFNLRHVDLLVMAGELAADEVEPREGGVPYDSERATILALAPALDEQQAFVIRTTIQAFLKVREAQQLTGEEGPVAALA